MTTLGDRIDEHLFRKMESAFLEKHAMRGLLQAALDADERTGMTKQIDGEQVRCIKHAAEWVAEVRKLLGKEAANAQDQ